MIIKRSQWLIEQAKALETDALKLEALRSQVKEGADALKRAEFLEIDEADVERYLEDLTAENR